MQTLNAIRRLYPFGPFHEILDRLRTVTAMIFARIREANLKRVQNAVRATRRHSGTAGFEVARSPRSDVGIFRGPQDSSFARARRACPLLRDERKIPDEALNTMDARNFAKGMP